MSQSKQENPEVTEILKSLTHELDRRIMQLDSINVDRMLNGDEMDPEIEKQVAIYQGLLDNLKTSKTPAAIQSQLIQFKESNSGQHRDKVEVAFVQTYIDKMDKVRQEANAPDLGRNFQNKVQEFKSRMQEMRAGAETKPKVEQTEESRNTMRK